MACKPANSQTQTGRPGTAFLLLPIFGDMAEPKQDPALHASGPAEQAPEQVRVQNAPNMLRNSHR